MSSTALTLYNIEEHLVALLDTAEMVEQPEQQEAIFREIQQALVQAVEKRDGCGHFLAHCETQMVAIDAEIKRLQALKKSYDRAKQRMEEYIVRTIQALGADDRGRYRKLEGRTCVFAIRACPPAVEVRNEAEIPSLYKTLTITIPATAWEAVTDGLDVDERARVLISVKRCEVAVDKNAIKLAIAQGDSVPGAELTSGRYSLVHK